MDKKKFKQSVNWYIKNGIPIVPVDAPIMGEKNSGKGVHCVGWQKMGKEKLWDRMKTHEGNVGIRLDEYLVLDVDCPEKAKILLEGIKLPETAVCYRSDTTLSKALAFESRAHFYFKKSKLEKTATLHDGKDEKGKPITVVELRTGKGAQMVAPPSVHYTGTSYLMHNAKMLTSLPECPPELIAIVTTLKDADESTIEQSQNETSDIDDIVLKVLAETPAASSEYSSFVTLCLAFKSKNYTYDQVDKVFACGEGYDAKENRRIYNACRPSGKVTMKTAYHIAKKHNPKMLEKLMAEGKKPKTCNNCGVEISFGKNAKGKWIPTSDGKPHRCKKSPGQVQNQAKEPSPTAEQEPEKKSLLVWKDEKGKPVEGLVAKAFFEEQNGNLIYHLGDFFEYNKNRGCWEIAKEGEINKKILDFVGEDLAKTSLLKNVAYQITLRAQMPKNFNFNPNPMLLNLKNCVIDIKTMHTMPHCRELFFDHSINAAFNESASCPRWRQFLDEVELTQETQWRLQEWFGYCLTRETRIEKCLYLRGEGANGKSRIIQTLGNMIGKEITSNLQPQDLVAEKHRMHLLKGKLLNFSTDINAKVVMDGKFKRIVSGEEVVGEPKNKDAFSFAPYAKHVFAANDFMPTKDRSFGFFRRFDLLELPRIFSDDEKDFGLQEKLDKEIDGIFLWALVGLQRLLANNWLMTESAQMQATMDQYVQDNNPVKAYVIWLQETGFFADKDKVETVHLYEQYKSWCDSKNYRPMGDNSFGREMARLGFGKKRLRAGGTRCHYYLVPEKYTKPLENEDEQPIVKMAVVQTMAAKKMEQVEADEKVKVLEEQKKQLEDALAKSLMDAERERERAEKAEKAEKKKNPADTVVSQQMLFEAKKFNHYEED